MSMACGTDRPVTAHASQARQHLRPTAAAVAWYHRSCRQHGMAAKSRLGASPRGLTRHAATSQAAHPASLPQITSFGFARGFSDHFFLGQHLGSGSFGSVHIAVNKITRQKFAVKTIQKKFVGSRIEPHLARRIQHEVDIYNRLGRSLNVAHMYAAYEDDHAVDMVMELCTGGELWQRVKRGRYSERQAAVIQREVLRAIAQCHAKGIVLRDVKPDNFLFLNPAENSPLKAIDFGLAEYCQEGEYLTDRAGSPYYVAPEVLRKRYSLKADVWSAGIVAYELLTGRMPFQTEDGELLVSDLQHLRGSRAPANKEVNAAILKGDLDFTSPPFDILSPGAKDFLQKLLCRDEAQRPSAVEALQHPWLLGVEPTPALEPSNGSAAKSSTPPSATSTSGTNNGSGSGSSLASGSGSGLGSGLASGEEVTTAGNPEVEAAILLSGPANVPLCDTLVQRLQRYGGYSKLKKVALRKVAEFAAQEPGTLSDMREAFEEVDPEATGKVPYDAAVALLGSGRFDLSEVEIRNLLSSFHIGQDGLVDYYEWLSAFIDWNQVQRTASWEAWVQKVFFMLDIDHCGKITTADLEAALCDEICPYPDEVPAALREVGHYENPKEAAITFEEFRKELREAAADRLELFESRRVELSKELHQRK